MVDEGAPRRFEGLTPIDDNAHGGKIIRFQNTQARRCHQLKPPVSIARNVNIFSQITQSDIICRISNLAFDTDDHGYVVGQVRVVIERLRAHYLFCSHVKSQLPLVTTRAAEAPGIAIIVIHRRKHQILSNYVAVCTKDDLDSSGDNFPPLRKGPVRLFQQVARSRD